MDTPARTRSDFFETVSTEATRHQPTAAAAAIPPTTLLDCLLQQQQLSMVVSNTVSRTDLAAPWAHVGVGRDERIHLDH